MMKHNHTSCSGFTLVELMMAMLATAILALTVGSLLVFAWKGWRINNESVNMQRDVSLAMKIMAREIRKASIENITDGNQLTCINATNTVSFTVSDDDLNIQVNSDTAWPIVRDCVDSFSTTADTSTGSVVIRLELATGSDDSEIIATTYSRN